MGEFMKMSPMINNISNSERFKKAFSPVEDKSAINLQSGDPDFKTPKHICDAATRAMADGFTHYCPGLGDKTLRESICNSLFADYNVSKSPSEILVTNGGAQAIFLIAASLLSPNDEAIVFDPSYSLYAMAIQATGASPIYVPLSDNFHFEKDKFSKMVTSRTRGIFLNTPNNPTATVFSHDDIEFIGWLARKYDLFIVSDEVYHKILYDGRKHVSILSLKGLQDRVILINSLSKTYAMTGWRLGYIVGDAFLIKQTLPLHRAMIGSVNTISQKAGIEALQGQQNCVESMVREYDSRRKMMCELINEIPGLHCDMPEGAFYVFFRFNHKLSSEEMAEYFLKKGVAVRSGSEFGTKGEKHIRLTFAVEPSMIKEGVRRIKKALEDLA